MGYDKREKEKDMPSTSYEEVREPREEGVIEGFSRETDRLNVTIDLLEHRLLSILGPDPDESRVHGVEPQRLVSEARIIVSTLASNVSRIDRLINRIEV